ncbi:hypothetical protein ACWEQJ_36885, partial [Streptomyces cyaneofuscatus]
VPGRVRRISAAASMPSVRGILTDQRTLLDLECCSHLRHTLVTDRSNRSAPAGHARVKCVELHLHSVMYSTYRTEDDVQI